MTKQTKSNILLWLRKLAVLIIGVLIMSFGGAFCVKSGIGLAPTTVIPYVLSNVFPALTFGNFTAIFNVFLILLQITLLRRDFKLWQLLQFFVALLFGVTVDFAMGCIAGISVSAYWARWLCSGVGVVLIAFGIALEILSDSIPAPADSTARAISRVSGKEFGLVKTLFDCAQVTIAATISLVCLHRIVALREGTLFLALCTGSVIRFFMKRLGWVKKFTS